jgi:hypothetical protein
VLPIGTHRLPQPAPNPQNAGIRSLSAHFSAYFGWGGGE